MHHPVMTSPHCMKTHTRIPKSEEGADHEEAETLALCEAQRAQCFTSSFVLSSFTMMQP